MTRSGTENFYAELEAFDDFARFAEFDAYSPVPDDWVVMAGDIKGSTKAIAAGRYKQVNLVGAAVVTAVLNASGQIRVPFVFGGDGGVVVIPASLVGPASEALVRLQAHSRGIYGLELRVAAVPVSRLRAEGVDVSVRKYRLSGTNQLAMFAGGGVERAEEILKVGAADDPALLRADPAAAPPDLSGLSCRWRPLKASHGRMMALMVQPLPGEDSASVLGGVLSFLTEVLEGLPPHAPAKMGSLDFGGPLTGLWAEAKGRARGLARLRTFGWLLVEAVCQIVAHRFGKKIGDYDGVRYLEELQAQTDFRKYDGCLRTVLDVTDAQLGRIETWLEEQYRQRRLVYGIHTDRNALMTCLVFSLDQGEHIHFVDAAGGGFAKAAEGFKARLAALSR